MAYNPKEMSLKEHAEKLTGSEVIAENTDGDLFIGILTKCPEVKERTLEVVLSSAQKVPAAPEGNNFVWHNNGQKKTMKLEITRLIGDRAASRDKAFRTDDKIAATAPTMNGGFGEHRFDESDNEFQEWNDSDGEEGIGDTAAAAVGFENLAGGWSAADMFHANRDKCTGQGTAFDESQFSNVEVGKHSKEELQKAAEIAKQIAMNPASLRNAQLENDDEERDLDALTKFEANEKEVVVVDAVVLAETTTTNTTTIAVADDDVKAELVVVMAEEVEEEQMQQQKQTQNLQQQQLQLALVGEAPEKVKVAARQNGGKDAIPLEMIEEKFKQPKNEEEKQREKSNSKKNNISNNNNHQHPNSSNTSNMNRKQQTSGNKKRTEKKVEEESKTPPTTTTATTNTLNTNNNINNNSNNNNNNSSSNNNNISPPPEPSPPQPPSLPQQPQLQQQPPVTVTPPQSINNRNVDISAASVSSAGNGGKDEKKTKFTFNPAAAPFVPSKTKGGGSGDSTRNSASATPISVHNPMFSAGNNFVIHNNNNNSSSSNSNTTSSVNNNNFNTTGLIPSQLTTFVPLPPSTLQLQHAAQLQHGVLPHSNIVYNNATIVYPQQAQQQLPAMFQGSIPLYAFTGNAQAAAAGHHQQPTTVFVQPNQPTILLHHQQQQGLIQQQQQQFLTSDIVQQPPQNHAHSRTGTPTGGSAAAVPNYQQQRSAYLDSKNTAASQTVQSSATTLLHHQIQSAAQMVPIAAMSNQTGAALPLMNLAQFPSQAVTNDGGAALCGNAASAYNFQQQQQQIQHQQQQQPPQQAQQMLNVGGTPAVGATYIQYPQQPQQQQHFATPLNYHQVLQPALYPPNNNRRCSAAAVSNYQQQRAAYLEGNNTAAAQTVQSSTTTMLHHQIQSAAQMVPIAAMSNQTGAALPLMNLAQFPSQTLMQISQAVTNNGSASLCGNAASAYNFQQQQQQIQQQQPPQQAQQMHNVGGTPAVGATYIQYPQQP